MLSEDISICSQAQTHEREWWALLYLFPPLYRLCLISLLSAEKLTPNFRSLLLALPFLLTLFSLSKSQGKNIHPLHIHLLSILQSPFQTLSPPLTISFLPSACWVSLHREMEYISSYHPTFFEKSTDFRTLRLAKAKFSVALLLSMLQF